MKRRIALLLIPMMIFMLCGSALAAPQISHKLLDSAKLALTALSGGEYDRLEALPFEGDAPSAKAWANFAGKFDNLMGVQTEYAVAYWQDSFWRIAVPVHVPDSDSEEVLVLTSLDGKHFKDCVRIEWGTVMRAVKSCEHVVWDKEYLPASPIYIAP